ncbi:hypothetical protein [Streptomyces werraensis]|uniref:hypothetical protein n=1 Tax=Streptomyces werraensis TaxID=68284 RepID=UPI001CE380F2
MHAAGGKCPSQWPTAQSVNALQSSNKNSTPADTALHGVALLRTGGASLDALTKAVEGTSGLLERLKAAQHAQVRQFGAQGDSHGALGKGAEQPEYQPRVLPRTALNAHQFTVGR